MVHTLVIFKLSTSTRNGDIAFSPTSLSAVPRASAVLSRTNGSGSFRVFSRGPVYAFNSFLFKLGGGVRAKQRARNDAVSAFTDGFLFSSAAKTSSKICSILICDVKFHNLEILPIEVRYGETLTGCRILTLRNIASAHSLKTVTTLCFFSLNFSRIAGRHASA